jgi:hypothetical protein
MKLPSGRPRKSLAVTPSAPCTVTPLVRGLASGVSSCPILYRSIRADGKLSDIANLYWAKDAVLGVAIRDLAWDAAARAQVVLRETTDRISRSGVGA